MNFFLIFGLIFVISAITETYCGRRTNPRQNVMFIFDVMQLKESFRDYLDVTKADIRLKKGSDSIYLFNGDVEQKVVMDDNWTVHVKIFRSDTGCGAYTHYFSFPKTGICTAYRLFLYPIVKNCTNFPDPKTCPLKKATYHANCELDASVLIHSKPGFYRVYADLYNNGHLETEIVLDGSIHEKF